MPGVTFRLDERTLPVVAEMGRHMPGGFFIYRAGGSEELIYANPAVIDLFGCDDLDDFKNLTGFTFKGMVLPEDYASIEQSIDRQIDASEGNYDRVEYRIVRKDGAIRWLDDYGHYVKTEAYGGIYLVFVNDITERRERMESDLAVRQAVIQALSKSYHTVWLINDVETETFSLYRGDLQGATMHAAPIRDALGRLRYSQAKEFYIKTTVAESDQERLQRILELDEIVAQLTERSQYAVDYLRVMDDGSERYFRIEFAKVDMPDGKMGIVCGFKDVDDDVRHSQQVQQALIEGQRAEEENLRLMEEVASAARLADLMGSVTSMLSNMPAMSFSKDAKTGVYLACNQAFAEYAGKESPEGVIGLTDHEIFDQETADHFVEDDQKALALDEAYVFFEDVPDATGTIVRNLQTTKLTFREPTGRLCLLGMCVDVTEMTRIKTAETKRKEMEERLALQERLLDEERQRVEQDRLITALASDYHSVYYVELDTNEGICYQARTDIAHPLREGEHFAYLDTLHQYADDYVVDEDRAVFLHFVQPDAVREGLRERRVISYRYRVRRAGGEFYEMIRFAGVRHPEDRDDHLVHAVGVCFVDVDVETRASMAQNEALRNALSAAEEASKAKTTFLSTMSHEIRTPMNAIIGLDSIALSEPDVPERTREHLLKIGSSAQHLLSIINDILDMSRIESGRMSLKSEEFSLRKVLEQVNTIIGGQCRDKGLDYECHIKGRVDDYYIGDDMKLRQVMINILGNAVKFTPEGGRVSFVIEEIARFDGKSTLRMTMSDTGIGMSPQYLPKIFEPFTQEDSSSTNRYGSTGLGMPITKNLVELMNGHLEVESEQGVGSTFTATVTLTDSERNGVDAEAEVGELHPHEMSVLVIDDDPVACEHAEVVLGQVGIACDIAASGAQGVEMVKVRHARREPYNLILVDWKMPEMDGLETTRKIREVVGHESAIIILTSYNWEDIADEARAAGVDTFVSKPLFAATVMDEFRDAFRRKGLLGGQGKADLAGRHILLAEDMVVNAEIMTMVLSMREMSVDVAENGQLAVDLFAGSEPGYYDAILMDMRMPVMDGLEATRLIRAMERPDAQEIPIIALTANAFDEDVQRSMQAGLNAHLSKPVEPEVLFETLESLVK